MPIIFREIEVSTKSDKFKRPSLSTATFTPVNNNPTANNNNFRKSSSNFSSSGNSGVASTYGSNVEVASTKSDPILALASTSSLNKSDTNLKMKSGITTGDNEFNNNNSINVSKIKVNDNHCSNSSNNNSTIVIDTEDRGGVVAGFTKAATGALTSRREAAAAFGKERGAGVKPRSISIPPKEALQSEVNKAFTDQLMMAKSKLKKQSLPPANQSTKSINSVDDDNEPDAGSPPPPPAPIPPPAAAKKEPSVSPSLPDIPIPPPAPFLNKPVRHLPPPPTDPREDLLLAIRRAGGVASLRKTRT